MAGSKKVELLNDIIEQNILIIQNQADIEALLTAPNVASGASLEAKQQELLDLLTPSMNSENRIDTVQHAHPNSGTFHFTSPSLGAAANYILVDISNTGDYPHVETNYIHLEWLRAHVDSDVNGSFSIEVGYLKNVDGTDGDFVPVFDIGGTKQAGNQKDVFLNFYPNGYSCIDGKNVGGLDANNAAFNTGANLPSTLDPAIANVPSGDGDLVLKVTVTAGNVVVSVEGSYHTHDEG